MTNLVIMNSLSKHLVTDFLSRKNIDDIHFMNSTLELSDALLVEKCNLYVFDFYLDMSIINLLQSYYNTIENLYIYVSESYIGIPYQKFTRNIQVLPIYVNVLNNLWDSETCALSNVLACESDGFSYCNLNIVPFTESLTSLKSASLTVNTEEIKGIQHLNIIVQYGSANVLANSNVTDKPLPDNMSADVIDTDMPDIQIPDEILKHAEEAGYIGSIIEIPHLSNISNLQPSDCMQPSMPADDKQVKKRKGLFRRFRKDGKSSEAEREPKAKKKSKAEKNSKDNDALKIINKLEDEPILDDKPSTSLNKLSLSSLSSLCIDKGYSSDSEFMLANNYITKEQYDVLLVEYEKSVHTGSNLNFCDVAYKKGYITEDVLATVISEFYMIEIITWNEIKALSVDFSDFSMDKYKDMHFFRTADDAKGNVQIIVASNIRTLNASILRMYENVHIRYTLDKYIMDRLALC